MPTIIEKNVSVGHGAIIHGATVESGCLVGMGAVLLDEAVIGRDSLVGAGALVTEGKEFPERSLIIGSPARAIRTLREEEVQAIHATAKRYVETGREYRKQTS